MKLAYLIQAHKNFKQIQNLIYALLDDTTDIYIHIDNKSEILYSELKREFKNMNNIYILSDVSVIWSGFSQVEATLKLMEAVKKTNKVYDYISLISGQDFPIKSNEFIKRYLAENYGKEFIEFEDIGERSWRLKCYNFFRENKNNRNLYMRLLDNLIRHPQKLIVKRNNFINMNLYFGSQWFTITYDCMLYILNYLEKNPLFKKEFNFSACPDEHFFQIIILNSKFRDKVVNDNLRYIDWSRGENSPEVLTTNDFLSLKGSKKLIARKFDLEIDKSIFDKISAELTSHTTRISVLEKL